MDVSNVNYHEKRYLNKSKFRKLNNLKHQQQLAKAFC